MLIPNKKFIYGMYLHVRKQITDGPGDQLLILIYLSVGLCMLDTFILLFIFDMVLNDELFTLILKDYKYITTGLLLVCNYLYLKYIFNLKKMIKKNKLLGSIEEEKLISIFEKVFFSTLFLFIILIFGITAFNLT